MATNRIILHLDLDAFFCAVEEQLQPHLAGQPFAVGGAADSRGVVASCSYPARLYGVCSAMPMARAKRLCPELIVVSRKMGDYSARSKEVMAILHDLTPLVQPISIDEAFMDVTGLRGTGEEIARRLQSHIADETRLPCSLGVASNKLVAKIANNIGKAAVQSGDYPRAITVVKPGTEAAYLAPLGVRELWGVGPKTAESLARLGITTIGDIAAYNERELVRRFGKHGYDLHRRAGGIDNRPVETERETKSVSRETTFSRDVTDLNALHHTLRKLSDSVGYRLRDKGLAGTTVKLKLRWNDFTTLTRQTTLPTAIDHDDAIYKAALALFEAHYAGRRVRLIGVGVSGFETSAQQLSLWDAPQQEANRDLQSTLDDIRHKFGTSAITRASQLALDDET
ncbi:MAG: DNA polymerase IV [Chloroflexota bacterium]